MISPGDSVTYRPSCGPARLIQHDSLEQGHCLCRGDWCGVPLPGGFIVGVQSYLQEWSSWRQLTSCGPRCTRLTLYSRMN